MRFFIEISYHGKNYHGWQIQENASTIQEEIDNAISLLLKKKIKTIGELNNFVKMAKRSSDKTLLIAIYNNQNQKRYIGVKLD